MAFSLYPGGPPCLELSTVRSGSVHIAPLCLLGTPNDLFPSFCSHLSGAEKKKKKIIPYDIVAKNRNHPFTADSASRAGLWGHLHS